MCQQSCAAAETSLRDTTRRLFNAHEARNIAQVVEPAKKVVNVVRDLLDTRRECLEPRLILLHNTVPCLSEEAARGGGTSVTRARKKGDGEAHRLLARASQRNARRILVVEVRARKLLVSRLEQQDNGHLARQGER